jgi:glucosylceramidase
MTLGLAAINMTAPAAAAFGKPEANYMIRTTKAYPTPLVDQATIYLTARDTVDRLHNVGTQALEPMTEPGETPDCVMVDASRRFQTIVGFGGALTDASAETFYKLPLQSQNELLTAYFSQDKGLGYSLARTSIHSCDFSSDSYTYDDTPGDTALTRFSIAHDEQYRIPFIKAAMAAAHDRLTIFASPWSPPAWMKTNNSMLLGGKLKPEYRQAWADYFVRFIDAYEKEGIPIWGLTVQNEPAAVQKWESCIYTGQEEHDFVKNYLGPTLHRAGLGDVKLMIWDHNRGLMVQRAQAVLEDPEAAKYVWGTAFHWYVGDHFENVGVLHDAYPDKNLLFSEGCLEAFKPAMLASWAPGERYGKNILMDLNHWCCGWTDWNVLLNDQGGPNHVGNYCAAPVIADRKTGKISYLSSYYYIGHFSKFIRPGAQRIMCSSDDDDLLSTAFINPDNSIVVVVLNLTDEAKPYSVWVAGRAVKTNSPAHSIETIVLK